MKTQNINSLKVATKVTFLATLLIIASCKSKDDSAQKNDTTLVSLKTNVKPPQIDIHTAVVTGNLEALKQHIAAGTNLNEKDPFGGSSPLISASLFGKTEEAKVLDRRWSRSKLPK